MVLGIIGGVFGFFAALFALAVGGISSAANVSGGGRVVALGYAAFFVSVMAIVGGALAPKMPKAAAILLLLTGVGGFVCVSAFWLLSGPLLIVGALLAFLGRKIAPEQPQQVQYIYAPVQLPQGYQMPPAQLPTGTPPGYAQPPQGGAIYQPPPSRYVPPEGPPRAR
jgi:hypothetical protein